MIHIQRPKSRSAGDMFASIAVITVFLKRKILSLETILRARARTHTHTHTCTHARTHTSTHAHTQARAHTRTHARTCTLSHTHTHARTHARAHTRAHTHTHTHTGTRPHKHSDYTKLNTQLKTGSKRPGDLEWINTHGTENRAARSTILGEEMFLD